MKDEIKEIINDLQRVADRKCYPEDILDGSIAQEWVDCITALQEENEISKQIIKTLKVYLTKTKETSTLQEQVMAKYVLKYIEELENVKKILTGGDEE